MFWARYNRAGAPGRAPGRGVSASTATPADSPRNTARMTAAYLCQYKACHARARGSFSHNSAADTGVGATALELERHVLPLATFIRAADVDRVRYECILAIVLAGRKDPQVFSEFFVEGVPVASCALPRQLVGRTIRCTRRSRRREAGPSPMRWSISRL